MEGKLTQEFLDELVKTQKKLEDMYDLLDEHFSLVTIWEQRNIGGSAIGHINGIIQEVNVYEDKVCVETLENDDGYYHHNYYSCPLYKLFSDDWKEPTLEKYKKEMEEKEKRDAELLRKKELAEFERLKEKYYSEN